MKAAIFRDFGQPLEIAVIPDPTPAPDEVIIRVRKCGICSSDLHMTAQHNDMLQSGAILGHEISGDVVALGREVRTFSIGDRVTALPIGGCGRCASCVAGEPAWCVDGWHIRSGGYSEYMRAYARHTVSLPDALSYDDGALIEPLTIALRGAIMAAMRPGARVLVIGAGPIGLGAAYWARRLGAGRVAVMARSNRRRDMALQIGASDFITANEDAVAAVREALGGAPEVVFECIGKPGAIAAAIDHAGLKATVVVLGFCMAPDSFVPVGAVAKGLTIRFSMCASVEQFETAAATLAAGHIEPRVMITETVALNRLPAVFESLRTDTDQCKVMVDPSETGDR